MAKYDYCFQKGRVFELPIVRIEYFENEFVSIHENVLRIKKDYWYNGCTGVPDFEGTKVASGIHDIMYQWHIVPQIEADVVFYILMKKYKCRVALLYFVGVRLFGKYFY